MVEKKKSKKTKEPDITFYHPDLLEVPDDGTPYLKGYQCDKCGQLDFPKLSPCPSCWGEEFKVVKLSTTGKLYSFSDLYIGQPGLETPYVCGYIDLPEDIRIFAMLKGDVDTFTCDETVRLTTGPIRKNADGLPIISYMFEKA